MGSDYMKGLQFADAHEQHFQAWKRLLMCSSVLLGSRFADEQELRFLNVKRSDMGCADMNGLRFADARNCFFRLGKLHIWVVPSW